MSDLDNGSESDSELRKESSNSPVNATVSQNDGHLLHYAFAHKHLPEMAYDEPKLILGAALDGRLESILNKIWTDMNANIPGSNRREGQINTELRRIEKGIIILVHMPDPQEAPEAKCMALVFRQVPDNPEPVARCYALERSYDDSYAIGHWAPDRSHANFGTASGDVSDFVNWIIENISETDTPT